LSALVSSCRAATGDCASSNMLSAASKTRATAARAGAVRRNGQVEAASASSRSSPAANHSTISPSGIRAGTPCPVATMQKVIICAPAAAHRSPILLHSTDSTPTATTTAITCHGADVAAPAAKPAAPSTAVSPIRRIR